MIHGRQGNLNSYYYLYDTLVHHSLLTSVTFSLTFNYFPPFSTSHNEFDALLNLFVISCKQNTASFLSKRYAYARFSGQCEEFEVNFNIHDTTSALCIKTEKNAIFQAILVFDVL